MADIKTKATDVSPRAFINQVDSEQRRRDCRELAAMMQDITGHPPRMWGPSIVGFDQYRYQYASGREADMLLTGFSPRKQDLVLYLGPGLHDKGLMAKLGKHRTGKGCLYLKTLDDVNRGVLRELIAASVTAMRRQHPKD
jgi:hypothetical protein